QGYRCASPDPRHMTPSLRKRFHDLHHDLTYVHDARLAKLEVHWRLSEYNHLIPIVTDLFGASGQVLTIAGRPIVTLDSEIIFLYLCVHGAFHAWRRLFWLCDVALFLHNEVDMDWTKLIRFAEQFGATRTVGQGVALAHQLLHAPLPAPLQHLIKHDKTLPHLTKEAVHQMLLPDPHHLSADRELTNQIRLKIWYETQLYPGLAHKIAVIKGDGFLRPEDWEMIRLPRALFPLYYLIRPFSWLWRRLILREPFQK
ncbi:MAG: nucleotidyltransferase family protein, partial [Candidatus Thorarchaeota archaeon]